jgi:hypothetical protein
VAEAFEVPLAFLMTPAHHRRHVFELRRRAAAVPVDALAARPAPTACEREYFIWGATAAMLRNLYRFLAALTGTAIRRGSHVSRSLPRGPPAPIIGPR